jgi:alpha-1,6-mannosyltransferase
MHVVHLTNAYAPNSGGVRTTMHTIGRGYREAGHRFTAITPGARPSREEHAWGTLITLTGPLVPGTAGYRALIDRNTVRRELDRLEPTHLEVSDRFTLRPLGRWAQRAGVPSVMIAHERLDGLLRTTGHLMALPARALADLHNRATAAAFDSVVATTRFAGEEFERIGIQPTYIPLGVDLDLFHPDRRRRAPEPSRPLLVMCTRLSPEKRPDLAIDALALLRRSGRDARLVVAGAGPLLNTLRRRTVGTPVDLLGHVADRVALAELLASADAVLAPGPIETFGLAALEALASGTPVVAARSSALSEIVSGDAGALATATPEGFANAVVEVLRRPAHTSSRAARMRAELFPWSRTVDGFLRLHGASDTADAQVPVGPSIIANRS